MADRSDGEIVYVDPADGRAWWYPVVEMRDDAGRVAAYRGLAEAKPVDADYPAEAERWRAKGAAGR